ncbi:Ras-related and estrogen-regulated growth inhibitor-like protein [Bagarius yarrelli]|uniref:small monomeric GTPase n=1 Tax=Bagarius yarrelli TaxID=175774 RepID=A0A556TQ12_BAGYA|nr:Ras-related and estrogen-regulated growth inhibitor-like protein [Bagarius yarrelli]
MVVEIKSNLPHCSKAIDGNQNKVEVNILLLGAENVGKSALTVRFLTKRFIGEYGNIESVYSHVEKIDRRDISFNIWDSLYPQSCESSESVSEEQLRWADGIVLVYSICDRASFEVVQQQITLIQKLFSSLSFSVPMVVVGNKRDLHHRRVVSSEEGRLLALSADCGFFEVSAAEAYHGVLLVFHGLHELIKEARGVKKGAAGIMGIMKTVFGKKRE